MDIAFANDFPLCESITRGWLLALCTINLTKIRWSLPHMTEKTLIVNYLVLSSIVDVSMSIIIINTHIISSMKVRWALCSLDTPVAMT